ncbi:hypothetical protein UA08_01122 [Talaromyces atroroseus]|uniref:Uncharacterized protein n=1 Tax=Talaromyces atroroseus TaxID=1441469 RepID=A0A225AXQ4_TALAT|nr:hypothetical protein UA08_01122 [Talaromyces atroroseus]OKL64403.1 hypothetical protein UA08_01122 [Talaromyces atroroseus]
MVYSLSLAVFTVFGVFFQWLLRWFHSSQKKVHENTNNQDVTLRAPYPCNAIKGNQKFRITMGLRKLDEWNWLTVDKNYLKEHDIRDSLLRNQRENVFQCLPESKAACAEVLEVVAQFLCERYPSMFLMEDHGAMKRIHNIKTGEKFVIGGANSTTEPLEIAVRLAMEDLSVLMKNADGEYYLAASATLFPVGWSVQNRIGWTVSQIHAPVPEWHNKVGHSVNKFFCRLTPESPMERSNYFLETTEPDEGLSNTLFRPDGLNEQKPGPSIDEVLLRRERQTFRRLPRTGALVFSVKTTLETLKDLPVDQLQALATEIRSWPDDMAKYKGRDVWGQRVLDYCIQRGIVPA